MSRIRIAIAICIMSVFSWSAHAAESGARAYINAPIGLNILQAVAVRSESANGSLRLTSHAGVVRYFRYIDVFGRAGLIGGFAPYAEAKLDVPAARLHRRTIGISDPTLVIGMDFIGAPALSRKAFRQYRQDLIIGGSLQITAPLGRYDPANSLNPGSNRWIIRPELAISQGIGNWIIDLYGHYHYFTNNKAYLGNLLREQKGRWGIDGHISYTIMRGMWVSLDYMRKWGGETSINGVLQGDKVRDGRMGFTAKMAFSTANSIELTYRNDVATRGTTESRSLTMKLEYLW